MNSCFILYRSAKVALKLVQKLGCDRQPKMYIKFVVFFPFDPFFKHFFEFLFFRNVDYVKLNRMPFEFLKSAS